MIDPELIRTAAKGLTAGAIGTITYNSLKDSDQMSDFLAKKAIYEYEALVENSVGGMCGYHYELASRINFMIANGLYDDC